MIKEIDVSIDCGVICKSNFYNSHDVLNDFTKFKFSSGVNMLVGDIDSGIWAVSYILSMYKHLKKMIYYHKSVAVDGKETTFEEITEYCCYLDQTQYPLFSSKRKSVRKLIEKGLKISHLEKTADEIIELFCLDSERVERPICCVGNERFRAMAAVGYAFGKQVFCFPWLSKKMFEYYTNNILWTLEMLEKLEMIVIVPVGR